jgi:hypothetical protein
LFRRASDRTAPLNSVLPAPGDLEATGLVQDARDFLAERARSVTLCDEKRPYAPDRCKGPGAFVRVIVWRLHGAGPEADGYAVQKVKNTCNFGPARARRPPASRSPGSRGTERPGREVFTATVPAPLRRPAAQVPQPPHEGPLRTNRAGALRPLRAAVDPATGSIHASAGTP